MGRKKRKAMLTADGYSIHTVEVKTSLSYCKFKENISRAFQEAKTKKEPTMYQFARGAYCDKSRVRDGVRVYYTKYDRQGNIRPSVKAVINPRKLLDRNSSYLGTMPRDERSLERLYERFTDVMREQRLPEFFEDWRLSRADLCINLVCPQSKIAWELIRTARKWPEPSKYKRLYPEMKHIILFHAAAVDVALYDKVFHITDNGLLLEKEKLPNGVLRIEVQYRRAYIRRAAKKFDTEGDSWETLKALALHSRPLLLKHLQRCFPAEDFCKPGLLEERIVDATYSAEEKRHMLALVGALRKRPTLDHALRSIAGKYGLGAHERKQLLARFVALGISPIPLKKNFYRDKLLSLPHILQEIEADGTSEVVADGSDNCTISRIAQQGDKRKSV